MASCRRASRFRESASAIRHLLTEVPSPRSRYPHAGPQSWRASCWKRTSDADGGLFEPENGQPIATGGRGFRQWVGAETCREARRVPNPENKHLCRDAPYINQVTFYLSQKVPIWDCLMGSKAVRTTTHQPVFPYFPERSARQQNYIL